MTTTSASAGAGASPALLLARTSGTDDYDFFHLASMANAVCPGKIFFHDPTVAHLT